MIWWLRKVVISVEPGWSGDKFARVTQELTGAKVDVMPHTPADFQVLSKGCLVERTFTTCNPYYLVSKDYEILPEISEYIHYPGIISGSCACFMEN